MIIPTFYCVTNEIFFSLEIRYYPQLYFHDIHTVYTCTHILSNKVSHWQHCLRIPSAFIVGLTSICSTFCGRIVSPSGGSRICFCDTILYISVKTKSFVKWDNKIRYTILIQYTINNF